MHLFFRDYRWKNGKPYGVDRSNGKEGIAFRLVSDPYQKWLSIEEYCEGIFRRILYNSHFLDFRILKAAGGQPAWRRERINEVEGWIFNEDDRLILQERCCFEGVFCLECQIFYPGGPLIALEKMSYLERGDGFNGLVLYDISGRPVMRRTYRECIEGNFEEFEKQEWDVNLSR